MSREIRNFNNGMDVDAVADKMAQGDTEIFGQFFKDVQGAEFLVPFNGAPNRLAILTSPNGEKMIAAFSSFAEFEKCPLDKNNATIMPFLRLDKILDESKGELAGVVINPNGKAVACHRNKLGTPGITKNEGKRTMTLSKPNALPEAIPAVLSGFFAGSGKVYKAYLLWAQKPTEVSPHLFIVVDCDGKPDELFTEIAKVLRPYFGQGEKIELAKADFKLMEAAEKVTKPFYKKG